MHTRLFICGLALLVTLHQGSSRNERREISEAEARGLAKAALRKEVRNLPDLRLDLQRGYPDRPGFYWFEATAFVRDASPVLGHFAVNRRTGDVWDPVGCKKLTSPDLKSAQQSVLKRISMSDRELRRLALIRPCEP